jgi:hypothetical protein
MPLSLRSHQKAIVVKQELYLISEISQELRKGAAGGKDSMRHLIFELAKVGW